MLDCAGTQGEDVREEAPNEGQVSSPRIAANETDGTSILRGTVEADVGVGRCSVSCSSMSFEGLVETLDDVVNEPEGGYLFSSSHNETSFALLKALMYLQGKYHSEKYASTEHLSDKELEVRRKSEELYRKLSSEEGSEDALWWQYFDRGCRSGLHPTSELASCMLFLFREIGEPIQPWELSSDEEANAEEEVETEEPVIESPPPPQEQPRPPPERKDLERVTIAELKTMAKDLGLRGYSKLKKDQLVEALLLNLSP